MIQRCSLLSALLAVLVSVTAAVPRQLPAGLEAELKRIAAKNSAKYNCSIVVSVKSATGEVHAAHGTIDYSSGRQASMYDEFPWGSVTKSLTGVSIMNLVSKGAFRLDDKVAPLVDPMLKKMAAADPRQNFSSLEELFGAENVSEMSVRQLLAMHSGMPDFDTAKPEGKPPTDKLRGLLYAHPHHEYMPAELMEVPWVAHQWKPCKPFFPGLNISMCYSSTNFMVLGLVLAAQAGKSHWQELDQGSFLPPSLRGQLKFVMSGVPRDYTPVHGYDRTSYNVPLGQRNDHDNSDVAGVFSGWTASNIVASTPSIARLAWEIYGPPHSLAPKEYVDQMVPTISPIYGLATFNLSSFVGQKGRYGRAYGHLGATYGYQSVMAYFPELELSIAVATNIETDFQKQPAHTLCFAYNAAAGLLLDKKIHCIYNQTSYYIGGCKCTQIESDGEDAGEMIVV